MEVKEKPTAKIETKQRIIPCSSCKGSCVTFLNPFESDGACFSCKKCDGRGLMLLTVYCVVVEYKPTLKFSSDIETFDQEISSDWTIETPLGDATPADVYKGFVARK